MARRFHVGACLLLVSAMLAQGRAPTLRRVAEFDVGPGGIVYNLAFSGDGKSLAGASGAEVLVWDVATGAVVARVAVGPQLRSVALSPHGTRLGTVSNGGGLRVTALPSGEQQFYRDDGMGALAWSADGRSLAVHLNAPGLVVFNAEDFTTRTELALGSPTEVLQLSFSVDSRELAVLQWRTGLFAFDIETGERRTIARGILTGAARSANRRWRVTHDRGGAPEGDVDVLGEARGVAWAPGSSQIVVRGRNSRWLGAGGEVLCELPSSDAVALHPDGDLLAVARGDHVELRTRTGALLRTLRGHRGGPTTVAVTSDGQSVLVLSSTFASTPSLFVYEIATGASSAMQFDPPLRQVVTVAGQPDALLASDQTLQLWHPRTRSVTRTLGTPSWYWPVWSPDGRLLWAGFPVSIRLGGETQQVLDLNGGTKAVPTPGGSQPLAWNRDGSRLLLVRAIPDCFGSGFTDLFLTVDGTERAHFSLRGLVSGADWSNCSDLVAVASKSGTLVLDGTTLVERARGPRSGWVRFIDDHHLVTSGGNQIAVWRADTGEIVCTETLRAGFDSGNRIPFEFGMPPGDAKADGRTIAVADELGVHVFTVVR